MTCTVTDCPKPIHNQKRALCYAHYMRWHRYGDPTHIPPKRPAKVKPPCTVDDCDGTATRRGWCGKHYTRWRLYGSPTAPTPPRPTLTPPPCSVDDCDRDARYKGFCPMHHARWRKHGDPLTVIDVRVPDEQVTYGLAHERVRRARGVPSSHPCAHCGTTACDWAYDHQDPDERTEVRFRFGKDREHQYSIDPDHYLPLCKPCHVRLDRRIKRDRAA